MDNKNIPLSPKSEENLLQMFRDQIEELHIQLKSLSLLQEIPL